MARRNDEVGALLQEYADLLRIADGEECKAQVYEKAARAVAGYGADVTGLDEDGLGKIPGVGASIAAEIAECLEAGRMAALEELHVKVPAGFAS